MYAENENLLIVPLSCLSGLDIKFLRLVTPREKSINRSLRCPQQSWYGSGEFLKYVFAIVANRQITN